MFKKLIIIITAIATLYGCKKDLTQGDADFQVHVEKTTIGLTDTLRFTFSGNPDIISFYSGEVGKRYQYRGRAAAAGKAQLNFRSARLNGGTQPNSLMLMVSSDFAGSVSNDVPATAQRITSATWTDITNRATLATNATSVLSGNIDLSDFAAQDKPVYIAFKYIGLAGSTQNRWYIDQFSVKNLLEDGTSYEIANHNFFNTAYTVYGISTYSPGFAVCPVENTFNWTFNSSSVSINGASSASAAANRSEAWAFIGPINLKKVTPDVGETVKTGVQKASTVRFTYRYPAKGTYTATFSGGKVSADGQDYNSKNFTITVN